MINTDNFGTKTKDDQYKSTKSGTDLTPGAPKIGMTKRGCVKVGLPVKGVSNGSVGS